MTSTSRLARILVAHRRSLAVVALTVLSLNSFVVVSGSRSPGGARADAVAPSGSPLSAGERTDQHDARVTPSSSASRIATRTSDVRALPPGTVIPGKGRVPHGIDGNKLKVVYYWKGDQTKSSQFLPPGTGQEGSVDEGLAFTTLVSWINKHARGGTYMGFPFNLHGWQLEPIVVEAGKGSDQTAAAETIASSIKPLAAVSAHGSVSTYVCPRLARAGIFNLATYDLDWDLRGRSNGYCTPQGLSWDAQVELMTAYLRWHADNARYESGALEQRPVYGLLYAEYPGLRTSAPKLFDVLRKAGVPVADIQAVDPDPTTAGRQQPGIVDKFRAKGVNTIIAPDSGSLLTFTHAAQGAGYAPDYVVWPCSGEDSLGMARLYNAAQWARAKWGLTCYDPHLNADLTNSDLSRKTHWYRAYQEIRGSNAEPPAQTALVYQALLPLLAGITHAGRDLTVERFAEGMRTFTPYRYDAIEGRTSDPINILVTLNASDGSQVGDAARVYWDPAARTPGSPTPGTYRFPEDRRYARGARFTQ